MSRNSFLCSVWVAGLVPWIAQGQEGGVTCGDCHADQAEQFAESVHVAAQAACQDCHGGRKTYAPAGPAGFDHGDSFLGKPARFDIPELCAKCHSDVVLMNPYGLPADQLARYRTSGHGKALFGDHNADAAVCTDCHDSHAILESKDPRSRTNPVNVPDTCGHCHGDVALMGKYGHSTKIIDEYRASAHGVGLLEQHDAGMPTCATCHGNHAAAPPGVSSVNAVCGRCHMQADKYFLESPHAAITSFGRCIACHGGEHGHAIHRVTVQPQRMEERYAQMSAALEGRELTAELHPALALIEQACQECHDEVDDAPVFDRASSLYHMIGKAEWMYVSTAGRVDRVGRGILLVDDERLMMAEARTSMIELASLQHTLSPDTVGEVVRRLADTTQRVEESLGAKERGLMWRHQVLWPMWGFIILFAAASYLKYRRLRDKYVKPLPQ